MALAWTSTTCSYSLTSDHTYCWYCYYWDWIPGAVTVWDHLDSTFTTGSPIQLSKFWALMAFQRKGAWSTMLLWLTETEKSGAVTSPPVTTSRRRRSLLPMETAPSSSTVWDCMILKSHSFFFSFFLPWSSCSFSSNFISSKWCWYFSLYYANVSVGTPSVSFLVALDTGSDLFWLPCDCNNSTCETSLQTSSGQVCYLLSIYNLFAWTHGFLIFELYFDSSTPIWNHLLCNCDIFFFHKKKYIYIYIYCITKDMTTKEAKKTNKLHKGQLEKSNIS